MNYEYSEPTSHSTGSEMQSRKQQVVEPPSPEDYQRMKESLRQAQFDTERTRSEIEDLQAELQVQGRKTQGAGWTTAILLLVLLGACAYGYITLRGQGSILAQVPAVQKSFDSVGQRLSGAEDRLHSWAANWDGLTERVGKLEKGVSANLRAARDFATEQTAKMHHQIQDEMDNRTRAMDAKLSNLESAQQENRVQLAALQQQAENSRIEAAQQLASAQQENGREFGTIRSEVNQNRDDLDIVARNLDRARVNFEVSKQQSRELAPGLAFTVIKTDVSHQQVDGYLHLIPEGRFLWVHGQGIEQPMLFHNQGDKRAYEMVFTRVGQDSAVGYVLMPRWPDAEMPVGGKPSGPAPSVASIQ